MRLYSGFVAGRPRTKGSLTPQPVRNGRGQMKIRMTDTAESRLWLAEMVRSIRAEVGVKPAVSGRKIVGWADGWAPIDVPVWVGATFFIDPVWGGHSVEDWPYPTAADCGDTDKLARAFGDALTQSGLIKDDRLIVRWSVEKVWKLTGDLAGVSWMLGLA